MVYRPLALALALPVLFGGAALCRAESGIETAATLPDAVKLDTVTIPSPGEMLAALNKAAQPDWQSTYRPPIPTTFSSRAQIALNIGGLIADGTIAVEAEDSQQVKNIGKDIIALAKSLAVSESVIARGNSIFDFAERNEWSALREELDATQNEVKLALAQNHDDDLIGLVTLGAWLRTTEVLSGWLAGHYTPEAAALLRQPAIAASLRSRIESLPEKAKNDPLRAFISSQLAAIEQAVSVPKKQPLSLEAVQQVNQNASQLMAAISKKPEGK